MRLVRCDGMDGVGGELDGALIIFVDDVGPLKLKLKLFTTCTG
jgi:hypothetical protein